MDDRTVANELQNGSTQSSLACKSCRRKKLKCDRSIPQCRNCQKVSRTCEYPTVAHKPGPRPGTHRRSGYTHRASTIHHRSSNDNKSPSNNTPNRSDRGTRSDVSGAYNSTNGFYGDNDSRQLNETEESPSISVSSSNSAFSSACKQMRISEQACWKMIEVYFNNVTVFALFHQPTFLSKLWEIQSAKGVQALLTTMFTFSIRFAKDSNLLPEEDAHPQILLQRAHSLSQACLDDCGDEPPPLYLLQSLTLQALLFSFCCVRGKAWRLVGQAIRIAYELRLHELDPHSYEREASPDLSIELPGENSKEWLMVEEKRRVWWALWELDVFSATLQRLPNAIDWTRNRTNLPSCEEAWFEGRPVRSCYLQVDPNRRWRDLRDCGNTSPIAWFVLINSYKWESLAISKRIAPPTTFFSQKETHLKGQYSPADWKSTLARKRETLENCLRCALSSLPLILQPTSACLTFAPSQGPHPSVNILRDHGRYMITIMGQVVQLLLAHKDLEGGGFIPYSTDLTQKPSVDPDDSQTFNSSNFSRVERKRWQHSLLVADAMAGTVRSATPEHYKYVNPNAATALWMGAATQLVVLAYHYDEVDVELATSNLDLLTTTIESYVRFWNLPETLLQSLKMLEVQLKGSHSGSASNVRTGDVTESQVVVTRGGDTGQRNDARLDPTQSLPADVPDLTNSEATLDLSPLDVLQAMDFGAMYNGVENWENLFLDPGYQFTDWDYQNS